MSCLRILRKKRSVLLWFVLLVVSCGRESGEWSPYVDDFVEQAKSKNVSVSVNSIHFQFGDLDSTKAGLCAIDKGVKKITFDKSYWKRANSAGRQNIVFHELGHCALNRSHDETLKSDGSPKSIMYPQMMDPSVFSQNKEALINELFANR